MEPNQIHLVKDKDSLIDILQDWENTFEEDWEEDEDYNEIPSTLQKIINKLEDGKRCTASEILEINFHSWQISCSEDPDDQWELDYDKDLQFFKELWELFGDVPVNEEDNIDEDFYIWLKGTDKFEIWTWFDEQLPNGVAKDLMNLE